MNHKETANPPVPGALRLLKELSAQPDVSVAIATGSWNASAKVKLQALGISSADYLLVCSDMHATKPEILRETVRQSKVEAGIDAFDKIIYIGDRVYDFESAQKIGIEFIGVDAEGSGKLKKAEVPVVLKDLTDIDKIINLIRS